MRLLKWKQETDAYDHILVYQKHIIGLGTVIQKQIIRSDNKSASGWLYPRKWLDSANKRFDSEIQWRSDQIANKQMIQWIHKKRVMDSPIQREDPSKEKMIRSKRIQYNPSDQWSMAEQPHVRSNPKTNIKLRSQYKLISNYLITNDQMSWSRC